MDSLRHQPAGDCPRRWLPTGLGRRGRLRVRRELVQIPSAKKGTTFRYTLSEDARVVYTIERASPGRRVGRRCRKPSRANRKRRKCTRYTGARRFAVASVAGPNRHAFSGRIGRRSLKPARYRATLIATDAAGNASARRRLNFRVVRR